MINLVLLATLPLLVLTELQSQITIISSIQPQQITIGEKRHIQLEDYYRGFDLSYTMAQSQAQNDIATLQHKLQQLDQQQEYHFSYQDFYSKSFQKNNFGDWNKEAVYLLSNNRLLFYSIDPKHKSNKCLSFKEQRTLPLDHLECFLVNWLDSNHLMLDCLSDSTTQLVLYDVAQHSSTLMGPPIQSLHFPLSIFGFFLQNFRSNHTFVIARGFRYPSNNSSVLVYKCEQDSGGSWEMQELFRVDKGSLKTDQLDMIHMTISETDLYILSQAGAVFKIPLGQVEPGTFHFGRQNVTQQLFSRLDVFVNRTGTKKQAMVVLAGQSQVLELDWTDLNSPVKSQTYSVDDQQQSAHSLVSFHMSQDYYIYELMEQEHQVVYILKRGSTLFANIFKILDCGTTPSQLEYDSLHSVLHLINHHTQTVLAIRPPLLMIEPRSLLNQIQPVRLDFYVFSQNYLQPAKRVKIIQSFTVQVILRDDLKIYNSSLKEALQVQDMVYPGQVKLYLDQRLTGPAMDYSFEFFSDPDLLHPTPQQYQMSRFNTLDYPQSPNDLDLLFSAVYPQADGNDFWWVKQNNMNMVWLDSCTQSNDDLLMQCHTLSHQTYSGPIRLLSFGLDPPHVYMFMTQQDMPFLQQTNLNTSQVKTWDQLGEVERLQVQGNTLVTLVGQSVNVYQWSDFRMEHLFTIDKEVMQKEGLAEFEPVDVWLSGLYVNYLFIKEPTKVVIVNIGYLQENFFQVVQTVESSLARVGIDYHMVITQNSLIFLSTVLNIVQEWAFGETQPYKRKDYPLYNLTLQGAYAGGTSMLAVQACRDYCYVLLFRTEMEGNNALFQALRSTQEKRFIHLVGNKYLSTIDQEEVKYYRAHSRTSLTMPTTLIPRDNNLIPYSIQKTIYMKVGAHSQLATNKHPSAYMVYQLRERNSQVGLLLKQQNTTMSVNKTETVRHIDLRDSVDGHILHVSLSCPYSDQCADHPSPGKPGRILLSGGLVPTHNTTRHNVQHVVNGAEKVFILTDQSLVIQTQGQEDTVEVDLEVEAQHQECHHMCLGSPHLDLVIVQCLDDRLSADQSILLGVSLLSDQPFLFAKQQIDLSRVSQMQVLDEQLLILETYDESQSKSQELVLFRLDLSSATQPFQQKKSITGTDLNLPLTHFSSFQLVALEAIGFYRLFITSLLNGLYMLDYYQDQTDQPYSTNLNPFLQSIILTDSQDMQDNNIHYLQIKLLSPPSSPGDSTRLLLLNKNFNHYVIQVSMQDTVVDLKVLKILVRYGSYQVDLNSVAYQASPEQVALLYSHKSDSSLPPYVLVVYSLHTLSEVDNYCMFWSGMPVPSINNLNFYSNNLSYYDPSLNQLVSTRLTNRTITFTDFPHTENTLLILSLSNGFVHKSIYIQTDIHNGIHKKKDKGGSNKQLYIILGVVIPTLLLLLLLLLRCRHKHRNQRKQEQDILRKQDHYVFGFDLLKKQMQIQQLKMES